MSEADVSLIHDEDLLRRMWQQTEDFSRKKQIRAHMYRLREQRLRSLYSPEPPRALGKGVETAQTHVQSFADQSFQGLKSKEVRDAGSPPKEFHYRGQDLKELSNAGWNVESENKTTDDGHTQVRAVHANIEGRYDVEGGSGKFAAIDHQKQAVTEYHDNNTSLKRKENSTKSGAHEQLVRKTDNGTEFSSTTSSSSASHFHQESSTKQEVPYTKDDYDKSRETNRNVERRQVTKTNEFEQNLRRNDLESGELVSRKVDYPDDNTKVIVETRCLEDGTRVTSTRREFRVPMQSTRSEQHSQTRSESKLHTSSQHSSDVKSSKITREHDSSANIVDSQRHADEHDFKRIDNSSQIQRKNEEIYDTKRFDTKESSSKITRETIDNREDIIDTQKCDDYTIKKSHQTNDATQRENYSTTERRTNQHYETKVNEIDCRESIKTNESKINQEIDSSIVKNDYSTRRTHRYETNVDESDRRENIISNDYQNIQSDIKDDHHIKDNKERTYKDRDQRSEDVIKKKTSNDQYQTTYQTDYTQKKISNDWSPSQQAWASTLRADTPASSRPTTRASSPGSRTYQSSTSSLRSSVSPDKHYMKPLSRGASPSKADRSSPSRSTTDKYSSTQYTHTLSETKSNRYTSPERKPPMSTSRINESPDRKPQYVRSSLSPEKRPSYYNTNKSPDRKPEYKSSPSEDSPRSQSPPRPYRSSISPEKSVPREDLKRPSQSPDRKPGYMKPTASRPTTDSTPTKHTSPDRKSPVQHVPSQNPDMKPYSKTSNIKEDHYKFVDEETKMYLRSDREHINYTKRTSPSPDRFEKSQSPMRKSPEDTTDFCRPESPIRPTLRKGTRSPSPPKGPVTFNDTTVTDTKTKYDNYVDDTKMSRTSATVIPRESGTGTGTKYGTYDKKRNEKVEEFTTAVTNTEDVNYNSLTRREKTSKKGSDAPASPTKKTPKDSVPVKPVPDPKEPSPTKYGTYDKKHQTEEVEEVTIVTKKDSKNIEYDSFTRREKTPNKVPDLSPAKKSPRDNVSRAKSPIKDTKYNHTSDFISTEKTTEAINKRTTVNDRPRQLITPSTSPTRKPKTEDTEPSTGQSSPTTSVSGFVYYSSPTTNRTIVTDLDDVEFYSETKTNENVTSTNKRPETLNVEQIAPRSKIPCRSPSPEKRASPTKDSLPRKSSLKKPSTDFIPVSPVEKPPTTFLVSPTDEDRDFPEHKIVKKDRPDKPIGSPAKPKPPLERRETYEERCRKILGMVSNDTTTTTDTQPKLDQTVSPCQSSEPKEPTSFTIADEKKSTKVNVSDFITREREDTAEKARYNITKDKKMKTPSRDNSPTKLQDIISQNIKKSDATTEDIHVDTISKTIRHSPDREIGYRQAKDSQPHDMKSNAPSTSTISHKAPGVHSKDSSPTRKSHDRSEPSPSKQIPKKTPIDSNDDFPTRTSVSPERKPGYMRSTASTTTKFESSTITEDIQKDTIFKTVRPKPESETSLQKPQDSRPSSTSEHPKDSIPARLNASTGKSSDRCSKESPRSSVSPDRKPGYMRPTATTTTKYDSTTTTTEDVTSKTVRQSLDRETGYHRTTSPPRPRDNVPTKPSPSSERIPSSPNKSRAVQSPTRSSTSPERKPGYTKLIAITTIKNKETSTSEDVQEDSLIKTEKTKHPSSKAPEHKSVSPQRRPEGTQRSYTPSPTRKSTTVSENVTELIQSEREQEVLDRVQKSLRKLSPTRDQRSPSRERSPGKTTISLLDIDVTVENVATDVTQCDQETDKKITSKTHVTRVGKQADDKSKESKSASKPLSRMVSPTKKPTAPAVSKPEMSPDSTNKSRSISPKKPALPTERPQSPQVPKTSGIKPKEPISSQFRKSTPGNTSPTKTEKIPTELRKNTGVTKQNSFTKTSTTKTTTSKLTTTKTEPELKRTTTPKGINKENVSPKKDDTKVTRTVSDISIKSKKTSPQRMKSKPEIQVSDLSTTKVSKQTSTNNKIPKSQTKLAPKPKSATALNTSTDDDDIIIDVEQAKSSRENSPDRICPTPVSLLDDVGTPRFPDEVSEPDDEFRKRTHHIIHETESLVDDIVEISEDEELFMKRTDVDRITESDECLLSVTDKVSKFTNKIDNVTKPKDTTTHFKDTERLVHSDFVDETLKSDKCSLSVSEKVNKFAKGPSDDKNNRSPSRKIVDEYDTHTIYQDDYTKLSVNDKAHLFIETAENVKSPKTKTTQKVERPDFTNVDESLKSDDCLLSVSDKVNKFVKTAEQFLTETQETDDKEKKVKEQYDKLMKRIIQDDLDEDRHDTGTDIITEDITITEKKTQGDSKPSFAKETTSSHTKVKDYTSPNLKPTERAPIVKITTLRSSEAVKKAKALFENIASTQNTDTHIAKLTDIGVIKKSPKTDSTIVLHPSLEDGSPNITDVDSEVDAPITPTTKDRPSRSTPTRSQPGRYEDKPQTSSSRLTTQSPEVSRTKSPMRHTVETTTTKTVLSRYPAAHDSPKQPEKLQEMIPRHDTKQTRQELDQEKLEKVPSYKRPTKTSNVKEEKLVEETEVSTRRGSGKFGVELRKTSLERSTLSSERRRSSTDHHQPCIEDIFELDLLEQMLEKVVGYEQRRRIRAQIRVAKKKIETDSRSTKHTTVTKNKSPERRVPAKSPERRVPAKSPERLPKTTPNLHKKTSSPERSIFTSQRTVAVEHVQTKPLLNGHAKEPSNLYDKRHRPQKQRPVLSPARQPSPDKKTRTTPSKTPVKPKTNRFNEYASAYMKKVGLNESDKVKFSDSKTKKIEVDDSEMEVCETRKSMEREDFNSVERFEEKTESKKTSMSKSFSERTSSKETIEVVQVNGKRSLSPGKQRSPERRTQTPTERLYQRSPSPDFKRPKSDKTETVIRTVYETEPRVKETVIKTVVEDRPLIKKETVVKTVYDVSKKVQPKQSQDEKPSWVMNRNLKKTSSEARTFSSKKLESEKQKYRAPSPSKVISKPIDVITSSYGPGPVDADGRPLFGIKALRNGASNYQVKGTVVREEYHSRNGGEPQGSVSVTAYSTQPQDLERLLRARGERPSRLHGLAAITTTKKFGGDSGTSLREAHSKEERATLDQFTHSDRRADSRVQHLADRSSDRECREGRRDRVDRREDKKTVRQSSVKSLTEKYIKTASEPKSERSTYPKAGLILRTTNMRDSVSSDSSAHAGLGRTDSAHSLNSVEDHTVTTTERAADGLHSTTTTTTTTRGERSFLDSSTKVTGVQDILTRMKNADIVIQEGDTVEDTEARALLNKFLGATVLMAGMQSYVIDQPAGQQARQQEAARSASKPARSRADQPTFDPDQCWDERLLRSQLEQSSDYEQRRRLRARIRTLMAEQEACASAVTEALGAADSAPDTPDAADAREEAEVTVTASVRRNSSEKTVSSSSTTKTSKVIESVTRPAPKPVSPFAKFRQLEKQNPTKSPNSPKTPQSPGSPAQPIFKFTDPALQCSALTIKERLLQWCRDKTRDYENVKLENFSTSWADGLAFCALVHHFLPDAFDYAALAADKRRHNFTLAFKVADEKAGIYPLLDVDDMVAMRKPDWKCVFTYVQSIHRRFKDQQ